MLTINKLSEQKSKFQLFIFPIKVFNDIVAMSVFALLISLRIVLQFTSIYLPVFKTSISIAWTPLMIIGWMYGPIVGFFAGVITDTISFVIKPSTWFWLYFIQEPIIGFVSGIFGSVATIRTLQVIKNSKSKIFDILFVQFFLLLFILVSLFGLIGFLNGKSFEGKSSKLESFFWQNSKYFILASIIFFSIIVEIIIFVFLKKFNKSFIISCYAICLACFNSLVMSFLMGSYAANEYYKFLHNGKDSPLFLKYGVMFYLIPRTIKESIKAPLQIFLLILVIPLALKTRNEMLIQKSIKWKKEKLIKLKIKKSV